MNLAIIGGGLSGSLLTYYLTLADRHPVTIYLFEKEQQQLSRGIAYRSSNEGQLLNVSAFNMNLQGFPAGGFYHWLQSNGYSEFTPDDFVPRNLFGNYLEDILNTGRKTTKHVQVKVITDEVIEITKQGDLLLVKTIQESIYTVSKAVIANGILAPADPFSVTQNVKASGLYQSNPWSFQYKNKLKENDHITLIGTGLTMLDHALGLLKSDKNFTITAFSRHGLLPLPHKVYRPYAFPDYSIVPNEDIGELLKSIRAYYKAHHAKGLDWRNLIDRIRTQVPELWKALNDASKKRFLRHVKPYWEIHRHRAPHQVLQTIYQAMQKERFTLLKGKISAVQAAEDLIISILQPDDILLLRTHYLINSSGLQQNISLTSDPLLKNLIQQGYLISDNNSLGAETDASGMLECTNGRKNIFVLGVLRRPAVLECTAAKEIAEQAFALSNFLMEELSAKSRNV